MKYGRIFSQSLVVAALCGCGGPSGSKPVNPTLVPEAVGASVRTLRVVARIDPAARAVPGHAERIGDRVDAASDALAGLLGLRLVLVQVVYDPVPAGALHEALARREAQAPDPQADLELHFSVAPLPPRPAMADLVQSRYLGRVVALRGLATLFAPEDQEGLHRAEVMAIQHGIGQVFGALPSCQPGVMSSAPAFLHEVPLRFNPLNLQLIRAHLSLEPGQGAVPPDVARQVDHLLAEGVREVCPPGVLDRRRDLLAQVLEPASPADPGEVAGLAALAEGRDEAAFAACGGPATRQPQSPAGRCAGVAAARTGRGPEAIRHLRAWLAHHPDDGEAVLLLAREVGKGGDDGAARALLARFVEAHPEHVQARINLGVAMARLGDLAGARQHWEVVLRQAPDNADARDLIEQLPR